jgi:hypothetical protein
MPEGLTTDLLSDFTHNSVDWLRRTTARHASLSSEEWYQLAIVCEVFADLAKKYRDLVHAVLDRGIEGDTLKVRLKPSMAFLGDAVEAMTELQQVGERAVLNVRAALDRIRNANTDTEAVHADLASLLALAEAEPPPVPEDILAAAEAGPFIRLDEFRKRR